MAYCGKMNASEAFRCDRSAHTRDWGPHWVAVVELLLLAVVTDVVVGAGYPYFKVCNTFAQIGAALADAAPAWLCALGTTRRRAQQSLRRRRGRQRLRSRRSRRWRSCRAASLPAALRVTSSPYDISEFTCWAPIAQAARALRLCGPLGLR